METGKSSSWLNRLLTENILHVAVIGFVVGAILALISVTLFSIGKTVYTYRNKAQSYSSSEYYTLLDDYHRVLSLNPQAAVRMIRTATIYNPNELDKTEGLTELAFAYRMLGDEKKSLEIYEEILHSMFEHIENEAYQDRLAFMYAHAIMAADNLEKENLADMLYTEMTYKVPSALDQTEDPTSLAVGYWYLVKTVKRRESTYAAAEYYGDMRDRLEPMLYDLAGVQEMGEVYTRLTNTAVEMEDTFRANQYQEELIQRMSSMLEEASDPDEVRLLHRYMGFAELFLGKQKMAASHFQVIVKHNPTPPNIYLLANTYGSAGDNECAYKWFHRLAEMEDPGADVYRAALKNALYIFKQSGVSCDPVTCCP